MTRTVRVTIDFSVIDGADAMDTADAVFDYLCDGGDGNVEYPEGIDSVDYMKVELEP